MIARRIYSYLFRCYRFGVLGGVKMSLAKLFSRGEEVKVYVPGVSRELFLRKNSSDQDVLDQIFVEREYAHPFLEGFSPSVILDAGAYVGYSAVYFINRYPSAKVIAIEPESSNFALLEKNTRNYKNIHRIHAALWSKKARLESMNADEREWGFRVRELQDGESPAGGFIPSITIPEIMNTYGLDFIDILKLDIEGAERELFSENCEAWVGKCKIIIIELHDRFAPGCSKAFYSALSSLPFRQYVRRENIFVDLRATKKFSLER